MRGGNNGVGISRGDALLGRVESFLPLRNKQVDELNEKLRAEMQAQDDLHRKELAKYIKDNKELIALLNEQKEKEKNPNRALVEPHALV